MMEMIYDEETVRRFVGEMLVEPVRDEVYLLYVIARKKYSGTVEASNLNIVKEFVRSSDADYVTGKIRGALAKALTFGYPEEALVCYLDVNPHSVARAFKELVRDGFDWMYAGEWENFRKIQHRLFSATAKAVSERRYFVVDIDTKDRDLLANVAADLEDHVRWITETRGGFHVIAERTKESGKAAYQFWSGVESVEIKRDGTTPVPGILQGGFETRRVTV